jgi:hypothetical protein
MKVITSSNPAPTTSPNGLGTPTVTNPTPERPAAIAASFAAPVKPRDPAMMKTWPKVPLCPSGGRDRSRGRTMDASMVFTVCASKVGDVSFSYGILVCEMTKGAFHWSFISMTIMPAQSAGIYTRVLDALRRYRRSGPMHIDFFAEKTDLSREEVRKVLQEFEAKDMLEIENDLVQIKDVR